MNRVLLIVKGEVREKTFFNRYKYVKKMDNNLEVVPFNQNIKELYRVCKEYIFNGIKPDNILDILKDSNISDDDKQLLNGLYTDVYLVFDFDIQNAIKESYYKDYFSVIKELVDFFNDSTSIGQILINYPMMDSIYHLKDDSFVSYKDIIVPSSIYFSKHYKEYLFNKKLTFDCNKFTKNDFDMMAAINLKKANYIVNGEYKKANSIVYELDLNQKIILDKQLENISKNKHMYVLNSSLFIDIDLYGRTLYFHERGTRLYTDSFLYESIKRK